MNENLFATLKSKFPSDLSTTFIQSGDGQLFSYADMVARSGQYANAFKALGLSKGDRIAVQVEKSTEALMAYLGAIRAGGAFLPLNTAYTPAEVSYFLGDAEPKIVVCSLENEQEIRAVAGAAKIETLGAGGASGSLLERVDAASPDFEEIPCEADDLAAILYTSGTTGRSKGAMLTHSNLSSNAEALAKTWHFTSADKLLHALPIYHTHGLFTACNTMLHVGASMIFLPRFDAGEVVSLLPQATAMMGVPTFYSRLLGRDDFTQDLVGHIRVFISGSAPLSPDVHREFESRSGHAILERYGMTETGMITSNPYDGARRAGTVGFPLPGIEVRISDHESGKELEHGEVGDIEVRGPNVFKGYWRMPDKTAEDFRDDDFFVTGDLGMIDNQGYLNIVGRDKDLIISGGFNVYPAEIEAAIDELPAVAESAVIGVPHPDFGEGVMAVVARKSGESLSEDEVISSLNGVLARFKQPKHVAFVDALPRNAMGKIQKKELRDRYAGTFQQSS